MVDQQQPGLARIARIGVSTTTLALVTGCVQLQPAEGSLGDRLSFYGNARVRSESTFDQTNGKDRHRGRVRARAGASYRMAKGLTANARVSTTSGDANNPHWDFGDDGDGEGFDGADLHVDRLSVVWDTGADVKVEVGKLAHVFAGPPVASEFVWDGDVSPAGATATWKLDGDSVHGDVRLAGYVAAENNKTGDSSGDPVMIGAQANLFVPVDEGDLQFSTSFMDWSNLEDGAPGSNQGNTNAAGQFAIWEAFAAWTHRGGIAGRQQAFVQFMNNVDDDAGEDTGFALGAKLGPSGKKGDTNWFASYYDLDANAVYSPVAQDDTPIAGTGVGMGMSGLVAGVQHHLADHVTWKVWVLTSEADDPSGEDPFRVRFDLDFKVR